jgi:hypothetical protein
MQSILKVQPGRKVIEIVKALLHLLLATFYVEDWARSLARTGRSIRSDGLMEQRIDEVV